MAFILANQPAICKKHSPSLKLLATPALILHSIIISFRPAWLARVLLCYKRTQSSGNDDVDEGQKAPFEAAIRHSEQAVWLPQFYYLVNLSLFVSSSFPSDPPGWLVHC